MENIEEFMVNIDNLIFEKLKILNILYNEIRQRTTENR